MREANKFTTFMWRMSWESGNLNLLEPCGPHLARYVTPLLPSRFICEPINEGLSVKIENLKNFNIQHVCILKD